MKIAIIGMGVAGTSVLREWTEAQKNNPSIEITVFSDTNTFGTGKAFQSDDSGLLMNQSAEFTSMIPEDDYDFVNWIKENHGDKQPEGQFYARATYGAYVAHRMNNWLSESHAHIIYEKVNSIRILENKQYLLTWSCHTASFDVVHICTGTFPYQDPYQLNNHPHTIADPFPMKDKLANLPYNASVGIIGTGLTGIDVFRYISAHREDINLSFFSRSGSFKTLIYDTEHIQNRYLTQDNIDQVKQQNHGIIPLETYVNWFKKELLENNLSLDEVLTAHSLGSKHSMQKQLAHASDIGMIQAVIKNTIFLQTDFWNTLTEADKNTFLDKYFKVWDKLRAPFPPQTGKHLTTAWDNNAFQVYNNLKTIEKHLDSFTFKLTDNTAIHFDYVINATGNDLNVSHNLKGMPLINQLVNERIVQAETFGGIQVTTPALSVLSQKYGVLHTLKAHGQLISGIQFGNSSVRIISKSAQASVQDIIDRFEQSKLVNK